jgi:hypothetical protein
MATVRDARRALARGHTDEALVALWNAVEPLRLRGDRRGLRAVGQMAEVIAAHGDGSQVREAERLLAAVQETLAPDPRAREPVTAQAGTFETVDAAYGEIGEMREMDVDVEVEGAERSGQRLGPLLWAAILIAIVIINIVSALLRE